MKRGIVFFILWFFFACSSYGYHDLIDNFSVSYFIEGDYAKVTLSWELKAEGTEIAILRGRDLVGLYPGSTTKIETEEMNFGELQYTVVWLWGLIICDYETGILNLGRLSYTAPSGMINGYYLYISDDIEKIPVMYGPTFDTKEIDEEHPENVTKIPLKYLYDAGIIESDKLYYIALKSYRKEDEFIVTSDFTDILNFIYVNKTWVIPEVPGVPHQPILHW